MSLGLACFFEDAQGFIADSEDLLPFFEQLRGVLREDLFGFGEEGEVHAGFAACGGGKVFPDFVGGEAEDGRDEADQGFGDLPEDGLRGAARGRCRREGVHAVFEDVEIERAQVDDGEFVDRLIDAMEFEGFVPGEDFLGEFAGAGEHVLIERQKVRFGDAIARGIEAVEIAEEEAEGVAQLAIELGAALHQVFAGGHVFAEVDGGDPEAHDFAAHALGDVDGIDAVAEGLGHGAALLIEGPAGGGDVGVGRAAAESDGGEQRGVEPAAVLIAAFEIEGLRCRALRAFLVLEGLIDGAQVGVGFADGEPACAGVEPDVEDVGFLAEA